MAKSQGIPRTAAAARRRGYKATTVDLTSMPVKEKSLWISMDKTGLRPGQLVALKRSPEPTEGMGHAPGFTKLCYLDKDTKLPTDCYDVPDDEVYYYEHNPGIRPTR